MREQRLFNRVWMKRDSAEPNGQCIYNPLSTLTPVSGRTGKESISVSMERHGRKSRVSCTDLLSGAGVGT